jgi:hypothetical protein
MKRSTERRDDMHQAHPKTFRVDGSVTTLADLLAANCDDPELCEWAETAQAGDFFPAFVECECIAA